MRLEGSLDAFSLPDIFSLLSMTKKTGGLHLRRETAHGVVWLGDGLITGGASDLSRLSLGRRLAGSGHVADNHLSAAVDEVTKNRDLGLAVTLRDSRAIDEGELHTLVSEHVVDTVFDLMRWPDGTFEFVMDEANIDDVGVARQVDEVVTEARHRLDIWAAIDPNVAAPDTVLSLALVPDTDPQLARDEWALLALVDGRRTVEDLVTLCGRGEYSVVVALAELVGRGLIRTNDSAGIDALLRRQDLVASLESDRPEGAVSKAPAPKESAPKSAPSKPAKAIDSEPVAQPVAAPVAAPEPVVAEPVAADTKPEPVAASMTLTEHTGSSASSSETELDVDIDMDDDAPSAMAEVASLPRSAALSREIASVTPQRPEPFMTPREPDHPEPMAAAAGGGMMTSAAPLPAGAIERDPSVNKSLLLRLIAGVRGL